MKKLLLLISIVLIGTSCVSVKNSRIRDYNSRSQLSYSKTQHKPKEMNGKHFYHINKRSKALKKL
jgi:hypothetical protein